MSRGKNRRKTADFTVDVDEEKDAWETVIDFTKIRKGGVPIEEVLACLRRMSRRNES